MKRLFLVTVILSSVIVKFSAQVTNDTQTTLPTESTTAQSIIDEERIIKPIRQLQDYLSRLSDKEISGDPEFVNAVIRSALRLFLDRDEAVVEVKSRDKSTLAHYLIEEYLRRILNLSNYYSTEIDWAIITEVEGIKQSNDEVYGVITHTYRVTLNEDSSGYTVVEEDMKKEAVLSYAMNWYTKVIDGEPQLLSPRYFIGDVGVTETRSEGDE